MASSQPVPTTLRSPAWLRTGWFSTEPAILELADGRVKLTTDAGTVFDAPLSEVRATYRWYRFQCGCTLQVGEHRYAIDLMRPNGGGDVSPQLAAGTRIRTADLGFEGSQAAETAAGFMELIGDRAVRRQWHDLLTGPGAARGG